MSAPDVLDGRHPTTTDPGAHMLRPSGAAIAAACLLACLAPAATTDARPPERAERLAESRDCLTAAARALLGRIEERFGEMRIVSTCRPGARIAGTGRPSKHASGDAVDFDAGERKEQVIAWLVENHHDGGTMTYAGMDHVHVDIGPRFVSLAGHSRSAGRWPRFPDDARMSLGRRTW